ncbi:hypothetical protein AgCh_027967 [Apium graveolens]
MEQEEEQGLIRLPIELIKDITERLSGKELANLASVCSVLDLTISNDNALWKPKLRESQQQQLHSFQRLLRRLFSADRKKSREQSREEDVGA